MGSATAIDEFLESVRNSGVVPEDRLTRACRELHLADAPSAKHAAKELIRHKLLTVFQAERLLEGRYRGFMLNQFRIDDILGAGGMGWLYIAHDVEHDRRVVVKVLAEKFKLDAGMLARFKLEAEAGMKLNHPNIIRTYELGATGNVDYFVMEFVPGLNIQELIDVYGPIPWPQACDLIRQAALGLQHAHEQGMVHRDIKPANILVAADGTAKLVDFGLALLDQGVDADEFSLAMVFGHDCLGTADYIAPEQADDSFNVDSRADIYSLGCTLYYTLTGHVPFDFQSVKKTLDAHRRLKAPSVRTHVPEIPMMVSAIVRKMMEKRPEDRFRSAAAVAKALGKFAQRKKFRFDFNKILRARQKLIRGKIEQKLKEQREQLTAAAAELRTSGSSAALLDTISGAKSKTAGRTVLSLVDPFGVDRTASQVAVLRRAASSSNLMKSEESSGVRLGTQGGSSVPVVAAQVQSKSAKLIPYDPKQRPITLKIPRTLIGRRDHCDLCLPSGKVSGEHCEILYEQGCWWIRDLASKNGVQVNGERVTRGSLASGDRVTVAKHFHFRFELDE